MDLPAHQAAGPNSVSAGAGAARFPWLAVFAILLIAAAWRLLVALSLPTLARDGVIYCWMARDLGSGGLETLQSGAYDQHPLYSTLILLCAACAETLGASLNPLAWQRCGQVVALLSGLGVILVSARLAWRLLHLVELPRHARIGAGLCAGLAAALPLNTWLSADVMSDQTHLFFYLLSANAALGLAGPLRASLRDAAVVGLCGGLAFLTRPEGAGVALVAGAWLLATWVRKPSSRTLAAGVCLAGAFALTAGPYVFAIGKLSTKVHKESVAEFVPAAATALPRAPMMAALERHEYAVWQAAGKACYETARAGRVVVLLCAIPVLVLARGRLLRGPLAIVTGSAVLHYMLICWLPYRHGYLDPRHALPLVMLLLPAAGLGLALLRRGPLAAFAAALLIVFGVLAAYSARMPHRDALHIRPIAEQLAAAGLRPGALLLGDVSTRRVAFYAGARFQGWPENEPTRAQRSAALIDHVRRYRPQFVGIELRTAGPLSEADAVLHAVLTEAFPLRLVSRMSSPTQVELVVYATEWKP